VSHRLIQVIGAGLAGAEAAFRIAGAGLRVILYEMRPVRQTAAHKTGAFAELVCSNSLKSDAEHTAPWLLKQELRRLGSVCLEAAAGARVPGGQALAVDREAFSAEVTRRLLSHPLIEVRREEVTRIPDEGIVIVASGPLTSDALAEDIQRVTGSGHLYFYDAICPIVDAEKIDMGMVFRAARYGKSADGGGDYLNCPLSRDQYDAFVGALLSADCYEAHIPEDQPGRIPYFEGCLPIEELARRGGDTLRFGPLKPVGLTDPHTGLRPWAVVQLRQENLRAGSYNLVGCQTQMKFGEQARVLRMIPGLENAQFVRYGQIHRNTYINAPALLSPTLQLRARPEVFFAGQISGVEGYVESIATGLAAGFHAAALARGEEPCPFPRETALGSLCHYVSHADPRDYQPANITFDLLPGLDEETQRRLRHDKRIRHAEICRRAQAALSAYVAGVGVAA